MLIAMKKLNVFQVGYAISHCSGMMDDDFFYILPQGNGYETVNPAISTSAIGICLIRHSYIRNCQSKACQGKIYVKEQKWSNKKVEGILPLRERQCQKQTSREE